MAAHPDPTRFKRPASPYRVGCWVAIAFASTALNGCGTSLLDPRTVGTGASGPGTSGLGIEASVTPGTRRGVTVAGGPVSLTPRLDPARARGPAEIELGTGQFANLPQTQPMSGAASNGADVTLDFANVDIRDVLRSVLGDLLKVNYVVEPSVQGALTLQTGRPVRRAEVLELLTSALQVSGFALTARDNLYRVVSAANAARETSVAADSGAFVTRMVPLRFVGAAEIARALDAMLPAGTTVRPDPERSLLVVSGSTRDVNTVLDHVASFDVDYMRGMSFALLPLRGGRAREVADTVNTMITASGKGVAEIVRVAPITRMNAILVTSQQPVYLERVRRWVERFDRSDQQGDLRLFVYRVQNGRAADLASVLRRALGIGGADQSTAQPGTGGTNAAAPDGVNTLLGMAQGRGQDARGALSGQAQGGAQVPPQGDPPAGANPLAGIANAANGNQAAATIDMSVTADVTNNALVITTSAQDYARIEGVLRQLDIAPLQVLIEATIAEVTLTNDLQFGLQYYIKAGGFRGIFAPNAARSDDTSGTGTNNIGAAFPGLNFLPGANLAFTAAGGSSVVLQALSSVTTVRVLSSPNLLVLNNRSARLQVGEQVPIATQSAISTLTSNPLAVNTIDYRDTGVILNITPRVNDSGLVLLDIAEEVSTVVNTTSSTLNSPTISQRRVTSSVAIQDGQTIGLGGLIKDTTSTSNFGIPLLKDIPIAGALFSVQDNKVTRTELIVLITPRVLRGRDDADAATGELRARLPMTIPVLTRRRR